MSINNCLVDIITSAKDAGLGRPLCLRAAWGSTSNSCKLRCWAPVPKDNSKFQQSLWSRNFTIKFEGQNGVYKTIKEYYWRLISNSSLKWFRNWNEVVIDQKSTATTKLKISYSSLFGTCQKKCFIHKDNTWRQWKKKKKSE